jgi:hypothetical protein
VGMWEAKENAREFGTYHAVFDDGHVRSFMGWGKIIFIYKKPNFFFSKSKAKIRILFTSNILTQLFFF